MPLFRNEHSKPSKLKHKFKPRIPNLKSLYNKAFGRQTCVPTPRPASECYQSTARLIASSNPPPPLPSDILYYIFSMMVEKNLKTLNTCILVNKSWCEHALPIFWREPFRGGEPICVSVVDNYIGCLSDEEREVLEECGIRLRTYKGRSSCINYAQYLRYLSMADLYTVVRAWTDRTQIRRSRRHSRNTYSTYTLALNLGQMLCKLFLSDRANILSLSLDWGRGYPSWLYAGGLTPNLTHLRKLSIHHINEWSIFSHLANYAVNIQDLEILDYSLSSPALHSEEVSLAKFIECQNRLTKFKLFGYGTHPTMIPWSLRSQAKTLKSVEIIHINFLSDEKKGPSLEGLVDCVCLEELCIRFCTDAKRDHLLPLHGATFPYLKKLHFVECTTVAWEELMISLIITNANTLEEVLFKPKMGSVIETNEPGVFDTVVRYCPNILVLAAPMTKNQLPCLYQLLRYSSCRLTSLSLFAPDRSKRCSSHDFTTELGALLPKTLKHLNLCICIGIKAMQVFLKEAPRSLETLYVEGWTSFNPVQRRVAEEYLAGSNRKENAIQFLKYAI